MIRLRDFPTVETTDGVPVEKSCHGEWVHGAMHCPTGVPCVTRKNIQGGIRIGVMMCMYKVNECVKMSMCEHMHNYVHVTRV